MSKRFKIRGKLGTGTRFRRLKERIASRGGAYDPAAVAAAIGRRKYGQAKMTRLSVAGRRKKR